MIHPEILITWRHSLASERGRRRVSQHEAADRLQFFLDYWNNYLTVDRIASDHGLSANHAEQLIEIGRSIHEAEIAKTA